MPLVAIPLIPTTVFAQEKKSYFETMIDNAIQPFYALSDAYNWISNIDEHVIRSTVKLLGWIYNFLSSFILQMPTFLFSTNWFNTISLIFCITSVMLTSLLGVIEGIKAILNKPNTDIKTIAKRFPVALAGAGFSPFLFEKGLGYVNSASSQIIEAGKTIFATGANNLSNMTITFVDAMAILAFDIVIIVMLFPLFLNIARRWFDILALGALTPLAASCWVFKDHVGFYNKWWDSIKKLSFMQLYYALFTTIMGILILGVQNSDTFGSFVVKLAVLIGGLWRMTNPPTEFKKHIDTNGSVRDIFKQTKDKLSLQNERKHLNDIYQGVKNSLNTSNIRRKQRIALIKRGRLVQKIINKIKK